MGRFDGATALVDKSILDKEKHKMLRITSLTNASILCNRGISRLAIVAAVLCLAMFFYEPVLNAQITVAYLQHIPGHPIPASPALHLGYCPPITFNPFKSSSLCVFGPFNLPGYSGSVYVGFSSVSSDVPELSWGHNQAAELRSTANGIYNWGSDTDYISLYNTSFNTPTYTINFYFDGSAPDPSALVLVVAGLEAGTTATVSGRNNLGALPLAQTNGGEYTFPAPIPPAKPLWWCYPYCASTSPTVFPGSIAGSLTFSNGVNSNVNPPTTDPYNTGWDIYQPNSPGLTELSLEVTQQSGDGIGFTLGYHVCGTLVGNSLDSRNGSIRQLYDINTATGAATNARPIGANWGLAFAPMSPEGALYALVQNLGTPVGDALLTVSPSTGAATVVSALTNSGLNGGAFAADPTTGILYGVDGAGNLFTVSDSGVVTTINQVHGVIDVSAMAFDNHGNLFMVDTGSNSLLKVDKSTAAVISPYPKTLSGLSRWTEFAGLAINPWSGTAYYTEGGELYSLNLTTGSLSAPVPVTGAEDSGNLASLTYMIGVCQQTAAASATPLPVSSSVNGQNNQ